MTLIAPRWILLVLAIASLGFQAAAATPEECTDLLQDALDDKNPDTRKDAVAALSLSVESGPLFTRLIGMLQDKDVKVRETVVESLSEVKSEGATVALHQALRDEVPEVSFAAAKALWSRRDPAGKKALLSILAGNRKSSSGYLSKQKRDALRLLHTPRTAALFAMRQGMGFAPVPGLGEGLASMQGILTDPGASGRASAVLMLSGEHDAGTLKALKDELSDKEWSVRAAAVHALSLRNDPELKKDLEPLLWDDKNQVRLRAAAGYLRLSAIEAKPDPLRK